MIVKHLPVLFFQFRADVEFLCPSVHPPVDSPDIVTGHVLAIPYDLGPLPLQHSPSAARVHARYTLAHHERESIQLVEELGIDHRDLLCDLGL